MNSTYLNSLINSYQILQSLLRSLEPVIKGRARVVNSLNQYVRSFYLAMIIQIDAGNVDHLYFINNLILFSFPEMDMTEYQEAVGSADNQQHERFLWSEPLIILALTGYDKVHHTSYTLTFYKALLSIADEFSSQVTQEDEAFITFKASVQQKILPLLKSDGESEKSEVSRMDSNALNQRNTNSKYDKTPISPEEKPASSRNKQIIKSQTPLPAIDTDFVIRVIIPFVAMLGFGIKYSYSEGSTWFLLAAAALVVFVMGVIAALRRCPKCGAWASRVTISSIRTGQRDVKVRRHLRSTTKRSTGTRSYTTREVIVPAIEYTLKEKYRCKGCGYESTGTRTIIDDKIR